MDVNRSQGNQHLRAQDRYREAMVDLVRRTRGKVQQARQEAVRTSQEHAASRRADAHDGIDVEARRAADSSRDKIDISEDLHARVLSTGTDQADEANRPKIERLKQAYRNGTLNTPERVERAADNMLRGADQPADDARPERAERADRADRAQEAHQAQRARQARRQGGEPTDPTRA